jgi:aspartate kinase
VPAVSYTGSQAGILTDSAHGGARITKITGERVRESLDAGRVVIVAGFQGVDPASREITTLGRGGSDTTAVALAGTLGAESCEILTDVAGVFTADPRVVESARLLPEVEYGQMLALADAGAGVLMPPSVEFARDHSVPVHVRSSFTDDEGTWVRADAPARSFVGIAHRVDGERGVVTVVGADAQEGVSDAMAALQEVGIATDRLGAADQSVSLSVTPEQIEGAVRLLHARLFQLEATQ